ncbi:MAG: aromatic acid decarboxylase [Thermoprotei archaeon]|nr:MAG: aromatic acid decarboxylase [Thermoprotei archaeon]
MRIFVGITGASGIVYALRLLKVLHKTSNNIEIYTVISKPALIVSEAECLPSNKLLDFIKSYSHAVYSGEDLNAPLASSSFIIDMGVVIPCSMKTVSAIAYGISNSLITRASLNLLRLKKPLVLVIRETPIGLIELRSLLRAAEAGAIILPAAPAFYHNPQTIDNLIDFVIGKVLDVLNIKHNLYKRWKGTRSQNQTFCAHIVLQDP